MKRTMFITRDRFGKKSGAGEIYLWSVNPIQELGADGTIYYNKPTNLNGICWDFNLRAAAVLFGVALKPGEIRRITIETE